MKGFFNFSPTALLNKFLESRFRSFGLVSTFVETDSDGTTMHCWVPKGSSDGRAKVTKPALVLLHGFGSRAVWQWYKQLPALQPFFDVYVPDLLFFGQSFTRKPERTEMFQAECVMKLMSSLGVPAFSVLGTSYGGFVAFRMAHLFPAAVKRVIISSSGVLMTPQDNEALAARAEVDTVEKLLLPSSPDALLVASKMVFHRPRILPHFFLQDMWNVLYNANRKEKVELVRGLVIGTVHALPVPVLQQEVLLIWGVHDRIFPIDQAHKLQRHLGEERTQLAVVTDAAHAPQLEQPTEFNGLVKAFLLQ